MVGGRAIKVRHYEGQSIQPIQVHHKTRYGGKTGRTESANGQENHQHTRGKQADTTLGSHAGARVGGKKRGKGSVIIGRWAVGREWATIRGGGKERSLTGFRDWYAGLPAQFNTIRP